MTVVTRLRVSVQALRALQSQPGACCRAIATATSCSSSCAAPTSPARSLPALLALNLQAAQMNGLFRGNFAARPLSTSTVSQEAAKQEGRRKEQGNGGDGAVVKQVYEDDITDQIPHITKPMGVVEGTSYTLLIIGGLAFAAAVVWAIVNELLIQPREYTCFNITLEKLRNDPRVTVRLGSPISGYGQESRSRQARQRIPHRIYTDPNGVEHTQVQFHARGPSGNARVSAEMYQDDRKEWQYAFLYVEVDSPVPQRLVLVGPQYNH